MALQVGQNVGPYRVIEQLGAGGMANVYKAYHARLDRYVSLKVMHQSFLEDPNFRARFEREAQIVARLSHPNIVPVYDFSDHEGQPYLVLKYIEGQTLKALMSRGALSITEVTRIMSAVGEALTYAHKQGVLHRDIKPSNIILDEGGTPYLTDFGLARIAQAGESTMSADVMLGTPQYISPEQARGVKDLDPRTDVYSFGVVLYEMVCGRVPFNADTPYATVHDHIYSPLPLPSKINPDIPPAVENVLLKALAKETADRYQSADELMQAFRAAAESTGFGGYVASHTSPAAVAIGKQREADERKGAPEPDKIPSPVPDKAQASVRPPVRPQVPQVPQGQQVPPMPQVPQVPSMPQVPPVPFTAESFERAAERFARGAERGAERFSRRMERRAARLERQANRWANSEQAGGGPADPDLEGLDDNDKRDLELDLATDEEGIRKRVEKRIKDRREFVGHLISFTVVNAMLWMIFGLTGADFPWPMFVTLGWGSGLAAHAVSMFFKTNSQLEKREHEVDAALDARYGGQPVSEDEYQEVRRSVYIRHRKRVGFFAHAAVFACINAMLWMIFGNSGADFPWPAFVTMGWGIGLVSNGIGVFSQSNKRVEEREEQVRRELERERQRLGTSVVEKRKNEAGEALGGESAPPLRLTDEGELTDSYVQEWDEQHKRKRSE
ncbi:MAG: protein kinase [Anaerolineae bacterium]